MNAFHKQRVFLKREDFAPSFAHNIAFEERGITLEQGTHNGFLCMRAIDSGESGFHWGRVSLESTLPPDSLIRTYAYTANTSMFGESADLDAYIAGLAPMKSAQARAALMEFFVPVGSSEDFYLGLQGRYLWLLFDWICVEEAPSLSALRIHMAGDHMVDYLPAIYRKGDDFTKRFVSVFDSMYMDMERAIDHLPARFDFENTDREMLYHLAQWVCVDTAGLNTEDVVARIRSAVSDYEHMHTPRGVRRTVHYLTGKEPLLIECADVDPNVPGCNQSALYRRLYGENPHKFFILLGEDTFRKRAHLEEFIANMRTLIPANTEFELVLLKQCVQLDRHTYLGVNSVVSNYVAVVIDENRTIHYDTMIGGNKVEGF